MLHIYQLIPESHTLGNQRLRHAVLYALCLGLNLT